MGNAESGIAVGNETGTEIGPWQDGQEHVQVHTSLKAQPPSVSVDVTAFSIGFAFPSLIIKKKHITRIKKRPTILFLMFSLHFTCKVYFLLII